MAIVPAAGAAERFGGAKLVVDIAGKPLLEHTLSSLLDGGVDEVVVILGPEADRVRSAVPSFADPRVRAVINPDPARGMFSSLQTGLASATGDPVVILPGDMPFVRAATVRALLDAYDAKPSIVSPRFRGKRGHPVILPPDVAGEIVRADPLGNLHLVLREHPDRRVDLDFEDDGVVRDVDTVGDLPK